MAVWYIGREDELLLDLDQYTRHTRERMPWGEMFFRRRLRDAITAGKLAVRDLYLARSNSPEHFHALVRLAQPMPVIERLVWQLHLGSDLYRGRADLMRAARGHAAPSLIIRRDPMPELYREPDRVCACVDKHTTEAQAQLGAQACAVWLELRGDSPWELFGPSSRVPERAIAPPKIGRIPVSWVMTCDTEESYGKARAGGHARSRIR